MKTFESFFLLQALRYEDQEIDYYASKKLDNHDKDKAFKLAAVQRGQNINISMQCEDNEIQLLLIKSFIYNRNKTEEPKDELYNLIRKWFKDIKNTDFGPMLLNAASQCEHLKIIFDFECRSVKNVDVLQSSGSLGVTYPVRKFIFVGAKTSDEDMREQEIKGVLAHEICHYVMRLVYQNNDSPYYKDDESGAAMFSQIVTEIGTMFPEKFQPEQLTEVEEVAPEEVEDDNNEQLEEEEEEEEEVEIQTVDDECNGFISTVYGCYDENSWKAELIVRPFHIQAQFNDNKEKLEKLEVKYKSLFEFCRKFVIPELVKFNLITRKSVQNFNYITGLLSDVKKRNLEFSNLKDIAGFVKDQLVVITTNIPKLFLLNVFKHFNAIDEYFVDIHNIFINPQVLESAFTFDKFKEVLSKSENLKIFIDCSKGSDKILNKIPSIWSSKLMFIVPNTQHCDDLCKQLEEKQQKPTQVTLNYDWMDLTIESQKILLDSKINFQNNPKYSLYELIGDEMDPQHVGLQNYNHLSSILDSQLMNIFLERGEVMINPQINESFFDILFQTRDLVKIYSTKKSDVADKKSKKMSLDQMLKDVQNQQFILISDKAGSGKSWIFKNFTNLLINRYAKKWICYIDLKQFVDKFMDTATSEPEFLSFVAENIIKSRSKFEIEIFKKLYKNGKVCLLFDGFDEIAPDCAEFVSKLFQKFQHNGGNQLWIATRDYFELDLQKKLNIDAAYKLDEFTEEHGVELIASFWTLNDIKSKIDGYKGCSAKNIIKCHPNFQNNKSRAAKVSQKLTKLQKKSFGLPQFYKMLADILKNSKTSTIAFTIFEIFEECVKIYYSRLSNEKGKLWSSKSIENQLEDLTYHKLHELMAMKSLFPEENTFSDLKFDDMNYPDEEIIALGILIKIGEKFFFSHETFREYYAAKYILRTLSKGDSDAMEYFIEFLTIKKYEIIRMFLNDALNKEGILKNIEKKMTKIAEILSTKVDWRVVLQNISNENLENLFEFVIKIFKCMKSYEQVKDILYGNAHMLYINTRINGMILKVHTFIVDYLNEVDLEKVLSTDNILWLIFSSKLTSTDIKIAFDALTNTVNSNFISNELGKTDEVNGNVIFHLLTSDEKDVNELEAKFEILQKYLTDDQIIKLSKERNDSILQFCIKFEYKVNLQFIWTKLEQIFKSQNSHDEFKELCFQKNVLNENVLNCAARCYNIEFLETFWDLLLKTFENSKEKLQNLIKEKSTSGYTLIHTQNWNNLEIVKFNFKKIKEILTDDQYYEMLLSRGLKGDNLLQNSVESENIEIIKFLWEEMLNVCKSKDEFLKKVLLQVDSDENNIFFNMARWSTNEIFKCLIDQLDKLPNLDKIKTLLSAKNRSNQNLLQYAAYVCDSSEFHTILWKTIRKYFNCSEIAEMVFNRNDNDDDLLNIATKNYNKNILKITYNEVKQILIPENEIYSKQEKKCLKFWNKFNKNSNDSKCIAKLNLELKILLNSFKLRL
ncbi:uncharacterized protein [Chironomus tepperi]|uniref:uncharacterized protein n=1 Tax=Chironomus tepperi TaxID=113505 RepID=UPI00391F1B88